MASGASVTTLLPLELALAAVTAIAGLEICLINNYAFPLSHWQSEPLGHLQHTDHPILLAQTNRDH